MRRTSRTVLPGFGPSAGLSPALPQPDRAPARWPTVFTRTADLAWARVLEHGHRPARAGVVPADLRRLVRRRAGQRGLRPAGRLGPGPLPLSRPALVDALVDLPFALPTAVAGIALTTLYARNGWVGRYLEPLGHQGVVHAARHHGGADLHRPAVRGPHGAAGAGRPRARGRGGGREPGRQPLADLSRG